MCKLVDRIMLLFRLHHRVVELYELGAPADRIPHVGLEGVISVIDFIVGDRVGSHDEGCIVEPSPKLFVGPDPRQS